MLPCVELTATLPPVIVPEVLVTSPTETMFSVLPPAMVPPELVSEVRLRFAFSALMTAPPVMPARVACDRYTTGASTICPPTSVCTIHTMSCFRLACCAGVSAWP
jgi:hypothetical protein